jgi:hypothetical protein
MNLWGRSQDSERWTIFRYNNYSHNTLVVDGQLQRVPGYAPIVRFSPGGADAQKVVIDMTSVYAGQLGSALRGAELLNNGQVLIQDEFCAVDGKDKVRVRWAMVTPADISIESDRHALLTQAGKSMRFTVITDADTRLQTYSTEPRADYDEPNPGTAMIGFEVDALPGNTVRVAVVMQAGDEALGELPEPGELLPLQEWAPEVMAGNE